jgi:signal transduction histidine kinase
MLWEACQGMIYAASASILVALFFLARFYLVKREIKRISKQLEERSSGKTEKKLDLRWYDTDMEKLAIEVNRQIDLTIEAVAEKRRTENELKTAISNISHDIRTPMTSILGYVQLLESEELAPGQRAEYVGVVKNGALRLKTLLEDFFELSIVESPDYPMQLESVRLNLVLLEVLAGFYEVFHECKMEPIIEVPQEEIRIQADLSAVKRVFENLLLNAVRHSAGDVRITLIKDASTVEMVVSNPAPLLKEEDLVYFFHRFYKADKTRSSRGRGLGLSIAKTLMVKMGGKLSAELQGDQLVMRCSWHSSSGASDRTRIE